MFFLFPVWPKTERFPLAVGVLILLNVLVFLGTWPLELRQASVVSRDQWEKEARALAAIARVHGRGLTEAEKAVLATASVDAWTPLFEKIQTETHLLTGEGRYRWDQAYPLFQSYGRSLAARPDGTSVFRSFGFKREKPWPGLLTHQFLHAGFWHLFFNMLFLWAVGGLVEERLGMWLPAFYVAGGAAAAWGQLWWGLPAGEVMVGASGAVSAILGFGLLRMPAGKTRLFYVTAPFVSVRYGTFDSPLWFFLPLWFFDQALMGLLTRGSELVRVGYGAHMGGFAFGALAGLLHRFVAPDPPPASS